MSTKSAVRRRHGWARILILSLLTLSPIPANRARAAATDSVCNPTADYFLGNEDYPEAVRLHRLVIEQHPDDALAHYHLGFAEGMMGDSADEIRQYQTASRLGLKDWGLYLNLGRAYLEENELAPATEAFRQSVALGPQHAEAHFNLGLAYERSGLLGDASSELTRSVALDPQQADARNMLALVDAEQGNYESAQAIWAELIRTEPNFAPAEANLAILDAELKRRTAGTAPAFRAASAQASR
jgi:tetratricopeptide (TPR) repeat protein